MHSLLLFLFSLFAKLALSLDAYEENNCYFSPAIEYGRWVICATIKDSPLAPGLSYMCGKGIGNADPLYYTTHTLMMRVFELRQNGTELEYQAYRKYALSTIAGIDKWFVDQSDIFYFESFKAVDRCNTTAHLNRTNGAIDLAVALYIKETAEPFYLAAHNYNSISELYSTGLSFRDAVRYSHFDRTSDFHLVNSTITKFHKRAVGVKFAKRTASSSICSQVIIRPYCTESSSCSQLKCSAYFNSLNSVQRACFAPQVAALIRSNNPFANLAPATSIQANAIAAMC